MSDSAPTRAVQIPDICARDALAAARAEGPDGGDGGAGGGGGGGGAPPSLSLCAGEFLEEYTKPEQAGDWCVNVILIWSPRFEV
jgi:hypothetical protein